MPDPKLGKTVYYPEFSDLSNAFGLSNGKKRTKAGDVSGKPDEKSGKSTQRTNFIVNPGNKELGDIPANGTINSGHPAGTQDLLGDTTRKVSDPGFAVDIDFDKMTGSKKG